MAEVARKAGAPIDEQATLKLFDSVPETMQSSMQKDAAAGRATEIEAIGGAILRAAERLAVEVPLTTKLVANIRKSQPSAAEGGAAKRTNRPCDWRTRLGARRRKEENKRYKYE